MCKYTREEFTRAHARYVRTRKERERYVRRFVLKISSDYLSSISRVVELITNFYLSFSFFLPPLPQFETRVSKLSKAIRIIQSPSLDFSDRSSHAPGDVC